MGLILLPAALTRLSKVNAVDGRLSQKPRPAAWTQETVKKILGVSLNIKISSTTLNNFWPSDCCLHRNDI
jgi:hypothetical protein